MIVTLSFFAAHITVPDLQGGCFYWRATRSCRLSTRSCRLSTCSCVHAGCQFSPTSWCGLGPSVRTVLMLTGEGLCQNSTIITCLVPCVPTLHQPFGFLSFYPLLFHNLPSLYPPSCTCFTDFRFWLHGRLKYRCKKTTHSNVEHYDFLT